MQVCRPYVTFVLAAFFFRVAWTERIITEKLAWFTFIKIALIRVIIHAGAAFFRRIAWWCFAEFGISSDGVIWAAIAL